MATTAQQEQLKLRRHVVMLYVYLCDDHAEIRLEDERYDHGFVLLTEHHAARREHKICNVQLCKNRAFYAKPLTFSGSTLEPAPKPREGGEKRDNKSATGKSERIRSD